MQKTQTVQYDRWQNDHKASVNLFFLFQQDAETLLFFWLCAVMQTVYFIKEHG